MKKWLKVLIILFTGVTVAGVTFLVNSAYINKHTRLVNVVVAAEDIPPYNLIGKYQTAEAVISSVPDDAVTDPAFLGEQEWYSGSLGIGQGDIIRKSRINNAESNPFGKALALKDKKILVGVKTDQAMSAGSNIKPGVIVNALVFIPSDNRNRPENTVVGPDQDGLLSGLLIREVQNADTNAPNGKGREAQPVVAVIETSIPAAQKLVLYQEVGKVYLVPAGVDLNTDNTSASVNTGSAAPVPAAGNTSEGAATNPAAGSVQPAAVPEDADSPEVQKSIMSPTPGVRRR
ncbi:hypothetical protein [Phosphitispora fastidiosa]|uniref:hypothetical protein n=1 Tax=Phosphitispora fastidiosa TaxID=2837202 RepID=UPI001E2ACD0E|nr:hypothetical protein [Phosphitispora fastidiosa]MBU7007059.1 hypothetical protein [Phosphitispora fastidiosa]